MTSFPFALFLLDILVLWRMGYEWGYFLRELYFWQSRDGDYKLTEKIHYFPGLVLDQLDQ